MAQGLADGVRGVAGTSETEVSRTEQLRQTMTKWCLSTKRSWSSICCMQLARSGGINAQSFFPCCGIYAAGDVVSGLPGIPVRGYFPKEAGTLTTYPLMGVIAGTLAAWAGRRRVAANDRAAR